MNLVIAILAAIAVLGIVEAISLLLAGKYNPETRRLRKQVKELSSISKTDVSLLNQGRPLSEIPWLNGLLLRTLIAKRIDNLIVQAGISFPVGVFVLLTFVLAVFGYVIVLVVGHDSLFAIFGLAFGIVPFAVLKARKSARLKKFEVQLPDALDLLARSLKAGHALTGGLQMVAEEFPDPLGPEFAKTITQITYGVGLETALRNMTERVDCADLRFLAVSIIIQRESGGNLAEILESIATLIRERFKLQGKIRALSAEGKLSAIILIALPLVVAGLLFLMNPAYIRVLSSDSMGRFLVFVAVVMILAGVAVVKRMIAIRV
jgi:tight adherence protein B